MSGLNLKTRDKSQRKADFDEFAFFRLSTTGSKMPRFLEDSSDRLVSRFSRDSHVDIIPARPPGALSGLSFSVLQERHQGNKRPSVRQLLHKNHQDGLMAAAHSEMEFDRWMTP